MTQRNDISVLKAHSSCHLCLKSKEIWCWGRLYIKEFIQERRHSGNSHFQNNIQQKYTTLLTAWIKPT